MIRQTFRIYPNKEQEKILVQWLGCGRFIWNHFLTENRIKYETEKKFIFKFDINKQITHLKKQDEYSWLKDAPSQILQQKSADLDTALKGTFRQKKGFPKYKSRSTDTSGICFPQSVSIENGRLHLPKMKSGIRIKQHREFLGTPGSCTIYRRPCGHWYASFVVKGFEIPEQITDVDYNRVVGLDLGIKDFLVSSDGEIVKNERFLQKKLKKLKRAQRRLSRKQKGSNNRNKQRLRVARIHEKIKNSRKDFALKTASSIAKNWDIIAIESLDVKSMMQYRQFSRHIGDVGWSMFATALKWQCEKKGKHLVQIGRYEPSTKTCSSCGHVQDMPLNVRTYDCDNCDLVLDRDLNAAINIKNLGIHKINTAGTAEIHARGDMSRSHDHSAREAARAIAQQ